jgi:hypothetical protein
MRRRFARVLGLLICAAIAATAFGSAPLLSWAESHRTRIGDAPVAAAAAWHAAMGAAGLDGPYATIRQTVRRLAGDG